MSENSNSDDNTIDKKEEFTEVTIPEFPDDSSDSFSSSDNESVNIKTKLEKGEKLPNLPPIAEQHAPGTIPLGVLIQFLCQRFNNDLIRMTKLVIEASDISKKVALVQFADTTRVLASKVLAIVKWFRKFKRYRLCIPIQNFLDQQLQYYRDTADALCGIARGELTYARMPPYNIDSAVDVICGVYARLPLSIKKRFIPEKSLNTQETANILSRINTAIKIRLSFLAPTLPPKIKNIYIKNGTVTFNVPGEFDVMLTMPGETMNVKWKLLRIRILMKDYETSGGKDLIHSLQLKTLHKHCQELLDKSKNPILKMYQFLHDFCVYLQFDLVFGESLELMKGLYKNKIIIEHCNGKKGILVISYWLEIKDKQLIPSKYKIVFYVSHRRKYEGIVVKHYPCNEIPTKISEGYNGRISVLNTIRDALHYHTYQKLLELKMRFEKIKPKADIRLTGNYIPKVSYLFLNKKDHEVDEEISFGVNLFTGKYMQADDKLKESLLVKAVVIGLNGNISNDELEKLLDGIRYQFIVNKFIRSVENLNVNVVSESIFPSIVKEYPYFQSTIKLFLQFIKEPRYYVAITFTDPIQSGLSINFFLISVIERKSSILKFNPYTFCNMKKGDKNERLLLNEIDNNGADRKLIDQSIFTANQIQSIVNEIENYTNGITVYEELYKKHIRINTSYKDEIDGSQYIKIKDLSKIISPEHADFFKNMKNIKLRKDFRSYHVWPLEYKLINTPLIEDFCKKQLNIKKYDEGFKICFHDIKNSGQLTSSNSSNEIVILSLMDKMKTFSMLHKEVARFSHYYYNYYNKYCNIKLYSYHKLIIAYGKERDQLMFLTYKPSKDSFLLSFGQDLKRTFVCGDEIEYKPSKNPSLWNAHNFVSSFLTDKCNKEYFLTDLVSYLIETNQPLQLLYSVIKEKVNCLSGFSQILVGENVYSEEFDLQIIANNERSFKIICAHMIMELFLSNDNYIYIKDCSKDEPKLYGLKKLFSSKETSNTQKVMDRDKDNEVRIEKGARSLPPVNITEAEETFKNPLSVPSSINISLNEQNTSMTTEDITGMSEENRKEYFSASRNIIRITHNDLETLLYHDTTSTSVSKLQNYLYSLRTFERLTTILVHNYGKPIPGAGGLTVHYVNISHLMVKISFASVKQLDGRIPCDINFTLYIEPYTFKIRLNLEYVGVLKPSNEEIKVAEEYFEDVLCYTDSPQKVYSFMNLIRMIFPKSFSCFTNLMILERNPDPSHFYRMNFDFVNVTKKLDDQMRKYTPKILVNEHSDRLLIPIFILPQKNESKKSDLCNRINLDFVWDAAKNEVYIHNISNEFMKMINQKVIQYNNTIKDSLECTIEACIRYILNSEINP